MMIISSLNKRKKSFLNTVVVVLIFTIAPFTYCSKDKQGKPPYTPTYDYSDAFGNLPVKDTTYADIKDIKMGATIESNSTVTFRFFSPNANQVEVLFYANSGDANASPAQTVSMKRNSQGIWEANSAFGSAAHNPGGQKYKFYRYRTSGLIDYNDKQPIDDADRYLPDIYARANVNATGHSVIIDPNAYTWDEGTWPANRPDKEDCIVYEMHVKDFTSNTNASVTNNGTYLGLQQKISYLTDLGVNCVELMPVHEFSTDTKPENTTEYSWGYLPVLFFAPEASYSSAGVHGEQVTELKNLIAALHQNGIRVILDVVLSHTNNSFNYLYMAEPENRYYFKIKSDGGWADAGTGNLILSDETRPFAKKLVVDNLKYWVEEFHIDGFRLDLAPATPVDTWYKAQAEAQAINSELFITAENWWGSNRHNFTDKGISQWNDYFRDAVHGLIKGNNQVHGNDTIPRVKSGIYFSKDVNDIGFNRAVNPFDTTNILESHDEETVAHYAGAKELAAMANGILLMSQGIPMLQMGQEFYRSKAKQDQIQANNEINWTLATTHSDLQDFTAYLIQLRLECPFLRMKQNPDTSGGNFINFIDYNSYPGDATAKAVGFHVNVSGQGNACTSTDNQTNSGGASELVILANRSGSTKTYNLPTGSWKALASSRPGASGIRCSNTTKFTNCSDITSWGPSTNNWGVQNSEFIILKKE